MSKLTHCAWMTARSRAPEAEHSSTISSSGASQDASVLAVTSSSMRTPGLDVRVVALRQQDLETRIFGGRELA